MLSIDDFDDPRVLIYRRVSTESQKSGTSLPYQREALEREVERMSGEIVEDIPNIESGATVDRKSLDEVLELAERDEFDVLAVTEIDRLTRAEIFESSQFFEQLRDQDITLYARSLGVIDWDDLLAMRNLFDEAVFARRWYERIQGGAESGCVNNLKEGKWPFGDTPFGYEKDEDNRISRSEANRELAYKAFELYVKHENRAEVLACLNTRRRSAGETELSDSQLRTLLESGLCVGKLQYDGCTVKERPALRVVDEAKFERTQELLQERNNQAELQTYPQYVDRALGRYGLEYLQSHIEMLSHQCEKCGGEFKEHGSTERHGETLKNYQCQDCGYQRPLIKEGELQEIHQSLPLRCPYCPQSGDFECEEASGFDEYRYICQTCGQSFKSNFAPNKFERAINHPDLAFDIDESYEEKQETHDTTEATPDPEPMDDEQATLTML